MEEVNSPQLRLKAGSDFYTKENPVSIEVYLVLEEMDIDTAGEVGKYLNTISPNLTVCPSCHVDDFVHVEGCKLSRWNNEED